MDVSRDASCEIPVKRKIGVINRSKYKNEIIKKARLKGEAYANYMGMSIPALKHGDNCELVCFAFYSVIKLIARYS